MLEDLVTETGPYTSEDALNNLIKTMKADTDKISDGYHTFKELYEFRKVFNAALFNEWAIDYTEAIKPYKNLNHRELHPEIQTFLKNIKPKYDVHKSWKHYDGEDCFGGGWFIVVAILPSGQISNHYQEKDWHLFKIPEVAKAKYPFDGHTPKDVLNRIKEL